MEEPENILKVLEAYFRRKATPSPLAGKKVMITAGPTREKIDPVRYISNYSTGKMAYAIADELASRGAEVTIISGPVSVKASETSVKVVDVESGREMAATCESMFHDVDIAVMCAAVADYTVENPSATKIKREGNLPPEIKLVKNPDIARTLGEMKSPGQMLVGFALETDNETGNALGKMERKNLDMIVLNSLRDKGAGFATDTNKVSVFTRGDQLPVEIPLKTKREVAADLADIMERKL